MLARCRRPAAKEITSEIYSFVTVKVRRLGLYRKIKDSLLNQAQWSRQSTQAGKRASQPMDSSQSLQDARILYPSADFVAPVRTVVPRPSPAGFLLGAVCAGLLVLTAAGASLVLSRSFADAQTPWTDQFSLDRLPSLSLSSDTAPHGRPDGAARLSPSLCKGHFLVDLGGFSEACWVNRSATAAARPRIALVGTRTAMTSRRCFSSSIAAIR